MTTSPTNNIFETLLKQQGIVKELEKSIDIYDFFEVICQLFDKLDSLKDDINQKMRLKVIYPDEEFDSTVINVTYDILDRRLLELDLTTGATIQKKAREYEPVKNLISDQIEKTFSRGYTNYVKFTVWSPSYRELLRSIKYIESVFIKHNGVLRQHVQDIMFEQLTETQFNENNFKQRMYNKTLIYKVTTQEMYVKLYEEIKQITISN
jgi:hypothetical protein